MLIPLILVAAKVLKQPLLYLSVFLKTSAGLLRALATSAANRGLGKLAAVFVDAVSATATQAVATAQQFYALREQHQQQVMALGRIGPRRNKY